MKQEFLEIWGLLRKWKWRALLYEPTGNSLLQFGRYLIVGGSAFVADALTLRLVEQCGVYYLIAAAAGFLVGVTVNYFLSTHLAFAGMQARVSRQAELAVFLLISLLGLGLTELLMYLFTDKLGLHYMLSKVVAAVIVFLWNFFAKKVLYRKDTAQGAD